MIARQLRCPDNQARMFCEVESESDIHIAPGNLIAVACRHCRTEARKTDPLVSRVIHRFNVLGELIETEVQHDYSRQHASRT